MRVIVRGIWGLGAGFGLPFSRCWMVGCWDGVCKIGEGKKGVGVGRR